ncbi:hypothetical protein ACP70R_009297 [Stipagrostis hirtigluma subsp. patula]
MAGGAEVVVNTWNEWGLQALVLLSFTLQVVLLVLAEFRRSIDSGVLMAVIWSAYMLADVTAIYVLGHISVTGMSPEHELMAFWVPFLLLHLGGQDNITAYAIEDNQLWLRHLQTLALQVAAATYALYQSSIVGSQSLLMPATIIMFVVGVIKYGERVWALKCASSSSSGKNYRCFDRRTATAAGPLERPQDTEGFLLIAHLLLDVPMDLLKGPSTFVDLHYGTWALHGEDLYKVAEMQLSLMHDVFYIKAEVMHTWYGLCIRIISSLGISVALLLFHLSGDHKGGYQRADITVTYVLLAGAVILEITSTLRLMLSSWTCALLDRRGEGRNMWHFLAYVVVSLRRLIRAADWRKRYWSGCMGQHNLLQLCAQSWASKMSKIARWMDMEDPWNTFAYSGSISVPSCIKQLIVAQVLKSEGASESSPEHIHNSRGQAVLKSRRCYEGLLAWSIDIDLEESILVWHIATDLYLRSYKEQGKGAGKQKDGKAQMLVDLAEAAEALSNYMLFLLAARPYMLPPPASRNAYVQACYTLTTLEEKSPRDLACLLQSSRKQLNNRSNTEVTSSGNTSGSHYKRVLDRGSQLGAKPIGDESEDTLAAEMLELITQVWVEILCYVGYRCNVYSHAKQLSNGGELITVAALLMEHIRRRTSDI